MNTRTTPHRLARVAVIGLSVSLLVAGLARADTSAAPVTPTTSVAMTPVQADSPRIPLDDKALYAQLQSARDAAMNKNQAGFITALGLAREALDKAQELKDEATNTPTNNLGVFPLTKVKGDLDSASAAADNDTPYWPGALEAVQSALATFQWYEQAPAHNLLAAYTDGVSAYTLAMSPNFRPEQGQSVLDQLGKAAAELQKAPATDALQAETRSLIDKVTPENGEIKQLLQHIHQQINERRQQSEDQYLQNIAAEAIHHP